MSLKFGIVGCGVIAPTHADSISRIDGAKLEAVYDVVPEKASALADKQGCRAASTLEDLIAACDVVNVCVPSGLHAEIGRQVAKAGKHLIVEKPIDVSLAAAQSLVEEAEKAGIVFSVISQHRFAKDIQRLKAAMDAHELGRPIIGDVSIKWYRTQAYYDSGDWRGTWALDGGGCLMNQGVHYVDMLQWVMGGVESVQAQVRTATHQIEVEDIATALVTFKNGAIGTVRGSTAVFPGLGECLEVHGEFGSAIIESDRFKYWEVDKEAAVDGSPYGRGVSSQPTPNVQVHGKEDSSGSGAADPTAIWTEQHRLQIEDVARAIVDKRAPFLPGRLALEPLKVILAIYQSARQGGARVMVDYLE